MALDAEGRAVQRMRSFTHLMPGEVQGCTGCHANRNLVTTRNENLAMAFDRPAQELQPPEWGVDGFSYPGGCSYNMMFTGYQISGIFDMYGTRRGTN
jgi:hypothetical protein